MSKVLHIITMLFCGIGLIFCIISESTNYWYEREISSNSKIYSGLWKLCGEANGFSKCSSFDFDNYENEFQDKIKTARAFTIMAIIAYGIAGLCLIIAFVEKMFLIIFIIAIATAAVFQMIGMAVFTDYVRTEFIDKLDKAKYGWSFALGWVGFVIAVIDAALGVSFKMFYSE